MTEEPEIGNKRLGVLIQHGGGDRNMLGVAGREGWGLLCREGHFWPKNEISRGRGLTWNCQGLCSPGVSVTHGAVMKGWCVCWSGVMGNRGRTFHYCYCYNPLFWLLVCKWA